MKIKFNSDDELSLNKAIEIPISSTLNGDIRTFTTGTYFDVGVLQHFRLYIKLLHVKLF